MQSTLYLYCKSVDFRKGLVTFTSNGSFNEDLIQHFTALYQCGASAGWYGRQGNDFVLLSLPEINLGAA